MKYMTFNSACSFAGIANMLESKGIDVEDYDIALGMELPYMAARSESGYITGAMLQEKKYFDIFLKKIGYELIERYIDRQDVLSILNDTDCTMLGIRIDEWHKHAVIYKGRDIADDKLVFTNNKHEKSDEPSQIKFGEAQLLKRLDDKVMIATLAPYDGDADNPITLLEASISCLNELYEKIVMFSSDFQSHDDVERTRDILFRPALLDSAAMIKLIGEEKMAAEIKKLQQAYIDAAFKSNERQIRLADSLDMEALRIVFDDWIELIQKRIRNLEA